MTLCQDCHQKLERLYDKEFYKRLGVADPRSKQSVIHPAYRKFDIGQNQKWKYTECEGWTVQYNEDQFQAICPECEKPGRLSSILLHEDYESIKCEFRCEYCSIRGVKKSFVDPHPDVELENFQVLTEEISEREFQQNPTLKKSLEIEEWERLAEKIREIDDLISDIFCSGISKSQISHLRAVTDDLDNLRHSLEERFFEEYPEVAETDVFY